MYRVMRTFILNSLYNGKNKYALFIYISILLSIFIIILPFDSKTADLILFENYHQVLYNEFLVEILKILIPLGVLIIAFEHDQIYLRNLTPTIGRKKVIQAKLTTYFSIIFICYTLLIAYYILVLELLNYSLLFNSYYLKSVSYLFLDALILLLLILLFVRSNKKILGFLIIIIYYMLNYLLEITPLVIIYYILPIHTNYFTSYTYSSVYKLVYILLLVVLNYIFAANEQYN